ncbi:hypothetical protein [Nocardioides sp. MH1]|uniref:hypothetical protein n=1 Tax=Nocardioides sp. MH1 TaxID=3242490 RepID=UPI003522386E
MIVRCIANTGASLPAANIDTRRGYDRATEFPLTIGDSYAVFAFTIFLGTGWYYVIDDDRLDWPTWMPASLFDVVDGSIPAGWKLGYVRLSADDQRPIVSFPEWADDPAFYERLVDQDPVAVQVFDRRRREIEA